MREQPQREQREQQQLTAAVENSRPETRPAIDIKRKPDVL